MCVEMYWEMESSVNVLGDGEFRECTGRWRVPLNVLGNSVFRGMYWETESSVEV